MKLLIDSADIAAIKHAYGLYPVDGVTTNPTILRKAGRPPYEVLKEIRAFIGRDEFHVQAVSQNAEGMVQEAKRITAELGEDTFVKIPAVPQGLKAISILSGQGVSVTATAIYTPMQAFLAAKAGAKYCAPYVNRIDNLGGDGVQAARDIHDIFLKNALSCQVLAASFKNSRQVLELCRYGLGAATAAPDIIEGLIKNPAVDGAVRAFTADFEALAGPGMDMDKI